MSLIKSLLIVVGIIIAIPLLLYPFLYLAQDNILFLQRKINIKQLNQIKREYPNAEVQITTLDNVTLHGWYLQNSQEKQSPLLIYFGGNAEEVSEYLRDLVEPFKAWSLLLVNYRGYGLSEGSPSEKKLFNDAVLLYDTFSKRADVDPNRIMAFGSSLGTGVAVYLASQRPLKGIILVSPYDSVRSVAQEMYPYAPVSLLLKHHFNSLALAPSIKIPMLALIAEQDKTIPPPHSFALIEAWGGITQQKILPNVDHTNVMTGNGYWESITAFINSKL